VAAAAAAAADLPPPRPALRPRLITNTTIINITRTNPGLFQVRTVNSSSSSSSNRNNTSPASSIRNCYLNRYHNHFHSSRV
jgi:hypothetical protein